MTPRYWICIIAAMSALGCDNRQAEQPGTFEARVALDSVEAGEPIGIFVAGYIQSEFALDAFLDQLLAHHPDVVTDLATEAPWRILSPRSDDEPEYNYYLDDVEYGAQILLFRRAAKDCDAFAWLCESVRDVEYNDSYVVHVARTGRVNAPLGTAAEAAHRFELECCRK